MARRQAVRYEGASTVGRWLGVSKAVVQTWLHRYTTDRTAAERAKAPSCPEPDVVVIGADGRETAGWKPARRAEWEAWRASLPGAGAGGGRPPRQPPSGPGAGGRGSPRPARKTTPKTLAH